MKKKGILLNTLISAAKPLPIAIALGLTVAMIVYMILVNVFPTGYLSESRFVPENQGGLEIVSTEAFYKHVSQAYAQKGGSISSEALKNILKTSVDADGLVTFGVRTANALTSYYIVQTALESAAYFYAAQGGIIRVLSSPSVPTTLSREDVTPYVLFFSLLAFAVVVIVGIINGLTLGKIRSEKEFRRTAAIPVVGVLTKVDEEEVEA